MTTFVTERMVAGDEFSTVTVCVPAVTVPEKRPFDTARHVDPKHQDPEKRGTPVTS
jgi:hypothetical protein